jgi:hypothetical protein
MRVKHSISVATLSLAFLAAPFAHAQNSVGALDAIQSETILYKAKAELAKARKDAADQSGTVPIAGESEAPVVTKVFGGRNGLRASLLFVGGGRRDVAAKETIPGGYQIVEVSLQRVTARRNGRTLALAFSSSTPQAVQKTVSQNEFIGGPPPMLPMVGGPAPVGQQ